MADRPVSLERKRPSRRLRRHPDAAAALAQPPWRLRFPQPLEGEFVEVYRERGITLARFTIAVVFVLHWAAILIDRTVLNHHLIEPLPAFGAYALALPMVTLYAVLAFVARRGRYLFALAPYILVLNGLGISILVLAPGVGIEHGLPHTLIILSPVFALLLSGMLLRQALPVAIVVCVFHISLTVLSGYPVEVLASDTLVISGSAAMSLMGGWQIERWQRAAWLREREFQRMADRDQLTGLASRHYLFLEGELLMRQALRKGRPVSALMIDVDHFKQYNDRFGHGAGDECLQRIAEVIREFVDDHGICARFGGEEFVVLLPGWEQRYAHVMAELLRERVSELTIINPGGDEADERRVSVSIGVAGTAGREGDPDLDRLIAKADEGLYRAKRGGRNQIISAVAS